MGEAGAGAAGGWGGGRGLLLEARSPEFTYLSRLLFSLFSTFRRNISPIYTVVCR